MRPARPALHAVLLPLLLAAAAAASASSATSSAASEGVSASVGSLSTSVERSSDSSSKDDKVADGDYRVIEVAAGAAGRARLTLQRDGARFFLHLPQETVARAGLAAGATVAVRTRDWGIEFAAGAPRRAFFLALHETWLPELQTRPLPM